MARFLFCIALAVFGFASVEVKAQARDTLVSDISSHQVEVRYSFTSSDLLLFGAINHTGSEHAKDDFDIVVVVKGPTFPVVVRRKERVSGIWMNRDAVEYKNVPGYYAIAYNRPLEEIASPEALVQLGIGFDHLRFPFEGQVAAEKEAEFRAGLLRNKQAVGLYSNVSENMSIMENTLFRTEIHFPSNVPIGDYDARIYLFQNGELIAEQQSPLNVVKGGFAQGIYSVAHEQGLVYGILSVLLALAAGWLAGLVSRKNG